MKTDAELRGAFAGDGGIADDGSRCPEADRLWASAREELPPPASGGAPEAILLHLAECGSCASAWRLARAMRSAPTASAGVRRPHLLLALAASLVLLVGAAALLLPRLAPETGPFMRGPGGMVPRPEATIQVLRRDDPVLRWSAGPEGTLYEIRVTDRDLNLLGHGWRLQAPEYRLDPAAVAGLQEGTVIHWQVTARLPDGREASSPTFTTPVQ